MLRIVADRNITFAKEAFSTLGEVETWSAREITPAVVRDADLLFVRSTLKVGPQLLDQSRVRFVATATIGVDHLDTGYLAARGIPWAAAPGSNADSVVQWFAAATATLAVSRGFELAGRRVGVVGVGQVGSRIADYCRALGQEPLLCDPPRARREGGRFVPLDELLQRSDLVTLHVPLEHGGSDPTFHLLDVVRLSALTPGTIVVNASRGGVIDEAALVTAIDRGRVGAALLDVFAREPAPDPATIAHAAIATPHIAGHSLDGKVNGTVAIYRAACDQLGVDPTWTPQLPAPGPPRTILSPVPAPSDEALLLEALAPFYRILEDDAALRRIVALPPDERARAFAEYRERYPVRRELKGSRIVLSPERTRVARLLERLGAGSPVGPSG
jgi:erythronate-4-phosphate dehydrogenase